MIQATLEEARFTAPTEAERNRARVILDYQRALAREAARHRLAVAAIERARDRGLSAIADRT